MSKTFDLTAGAERRGRRGRPRVGFGPDVNTTITGDPTSAAIHNRLSQRSRTPNEDAGWRLVKSLGPYEISEELRHIFRNEVIDIPSLSTMNMDTLAATLILLWHNDTDNMNRSPEDKQLNVEKFNYYVIKVLPTLAGPKASEAQLQRHREDILRYLRVIIVHRAAREEEIKRIQQEQLQQPAEPPSEQLQQPPAE